MKKALSLLMVLPFIFVFHWGGQLLTAQALPEKAPKIRTSSAYSRVQNFDLSFMAASLGSIDLDLGITEESKYFLLMIAVDKYNFWKPLNNAVKDARDVRKILMEKYGFKPENIYELLNEEVTTENLEAQFQALKEKGSNIDNLLIYYSGHGYYDPSFDLGYWVPSNGKTNSGATASYIPNTKVRDFIRELDFQHIFLIADACFSGALFADDSRGFEEAESLKSRWGLSSGNIEVVSDGKKGENSPFAKFLLQYLEENSTKDYVDVRELSGYVSSSVSASTSQTPIFGYLSGVGSEGGRFLLRSSGQAEPSEEEKAKAKKK
ncbi:MAG: caspase family protein [Microscillaceae bacterium]|nr:caspase family protein [Microscillaceae bacterium]